MENFGNNAIFVFIFCSIPLVLIYFSVGKTPAKSAEDFIFKGPRGGKYRINKKGRKSYDVK